MFMYMYMYMYMYSYLSDCLSECTQHLPTTRRACATRTEARASSAECRAERARDSMTDTRLCHLRKHWSCNNASRDERRAHRLWPPLATGFKRAGAGTENRKRRNICNL